MKSTYCVFNKRKETFLALNVVRAASKFARLWRMTGRLRPGEGLWVVPSRGAHTLGFLFPVDVIYLDADYRVIHLIEHMNPFRVAPIRLNCASVLKMAAHTIYSSQTELGDSLLIGLPEDLPLGVQPYLSSTRARRVQGVADRAITGARCPQGHGWSWRVCEGLEMLGGLARAAVGVEDDG